MDSQTPQKATTSLKWLYLCWFGLIFSSVWIGTIAAIAQGPPEPVVKNWGINDFSLFAIVLYTLGSTIAVIILYFLLKQRKVNLAVIGLTGKLSLRAGGYISVGLVMAFILYPLVEVAVKALGVTMFYRPEKEMPVFIASSVDILLLAVFAVLLGPIVEEIIFRGYTITMLTQRGIKVTYAVLLSALIFTSVHLFIGAGVMVFIFLWSLIPAFLYLKFKSLYPAMIFHAINNLITYIVFPLLSR